LDARRSSALALRSERQSTRISKIKNDGLGQYGAELFEQQQFGMAGDEGVNAVCMSEIFCFRSHLRLELI